MAADRWEPPVIMRRNGQLVSVSRPLTEGTHTAFASVDAEGRLSLRLGGESEAVKSGAGPLLRQPADGLKVGQDDGGRVGPCKDRFPFNGAIAKVLLTLGDIK